MIIKLEKNSIQVPLQKKLPIFIISNCIGCCTRNVTNKKIAEIFLHKILHFHFV